MPMATLLITALVGGSSVKALRNKLVSQSGASILLALAVMLVCAMVASVVLFAAAANVGKSGGVDARTRAFHSVSSAAQLLADNFADEVPRAEVSTIAHSYACQAVHPTYVHDDADVVSELDLTFVARYVSTSPFIQTIDNALHAIDPNDSSSSFEETLTLHAPELDDVVAIVKMDFEYNITVELSSVSDSGYQYAMTLQIPAMRSDPVSTTTSELSDGHMDGWEYSEEAQSLSWKETTTLNPATGSYEPLSNEYGSATLQMYEVVTTTTTRTISWGSASLSKGVAQ